MLCLSTKQTDGTKQMTTAQALKIARANVNKLTFGTPQWEAAMAEVRALVEAINAAAPRFEHTSIEGDVWSV